MRGRVMIGVLVVLLSSFTGQAFAGQQWLEPVQNECTASISGPGTADQAALQDPLDQAIFLAGQTCSSVADCDCPYEPACYCAGSTIKRCICNMNLCCPGGECP